MRNLRSGAVFVVLVVALTVVPAAATASPGPPSTLGQPRTPAAEPSTVSCTYTPAIPADDFKGVPTFDPASVAQPFTVTLHTTQGVIAFQALTAQAPCTTFSFKFLAERDYFDGTHCQRLTTENIYVLQCGDPTGTGAGGPGYNFDDENLAGATYPAGTVAMANSGPNTNGSQFFITWKDTTLPPLYTPFGKVTEGMNVLERIGAAGDDQQNGPGDGYPNLYVGFKYVSVTPPG